MIDIKELRRKLQSDDIVDHIDIHANVKPILTEILDRLEAAEKERDALRAAVRHEADCVEAAKAEIDELRAKVEAMERQEPYAFAVNFPESSRVELVHDLDEAYEDMTYEAYEVRKLYLAPGAQPTPSVPDGWREGVESAARLIDMKADLYSTRFGHDDMGGLSFGTGAHAEIKMDHYTSLLELADEVRAMLASAPKPEGE